MTGRKERPQRRDHVFVVRQILEQSQEWNSSVYGVFVDFERAFDSIHCTSRFPLENLLFSLAIDWVMEKVSQGK